MGEHVFIVLKFNWKSCM